VCTDAMGRRIMTPQFILAGAKMYFKNIKMTVFKDLNEIHVSCAQIS
jgi:hypothetical protein